MPPPKAELNPIRLGFLFYLFILFSPSAATVDLTQLQLGGMHKVQFPCGKGKFDAASMWAYSSKP